MFGKLIKAGIAGSKAAAPDALIAIHTDLGNHIQSAGIRYIIHTAKLLL